MRCFGCGKELADGVMFCKYCGKKQPDSDITVNVDDEPAGDAVANGGYDIKIEDSVINKPVAEKMDYGTGYIQMKKRAPKKKGNAGTILLIIVLLLISAISVGIIILYVCGGYIEFGNIREKKNPIILPGYETVVEENSDDNPDDINTDSTETAEASNTTNSGTQDESSAEPAKETTEAATLQTVSEEETEAVTASTTEENDNKAAEEVPASETQKAEADTQEQSETETADTNLTAEEKWAVGERGSYFQCNGVLPANIDQKIFDMSAEDFSLYTGIALTENSADVKDNRYRKFFLSQLRSEIVNVNVLDTSYILESPNKQICEARIYYTQFSPINYDYIKEIDDSFNRKLENDCREILAYREYDEEGTQSVAIWKNQCYRLDVSNNKYTYYDNAWLDGPLDAQVEEAQETTNAFYDYVSSVVEENYWPEIDVDINEEYRNANKYNDAVISNLSNYRYVTNSRAEYYLQDGTPVCIVCRAGKGGWNAHRVYTGSAIFYAEVTDSNGCTKYYFAGDLVRVELPDGELVDYGSKNWKEYNEMGEKLKEERASLVQML